MGLLLRRRIRRLWLIVVVLCLLLTAAGVPGGAQEATVWVIPVKGEIDRGLASLVHREVQKAEQTPGVQAVLFEIDTPGGLVLAATDLKQTILNTHLDTVAWVSGQAWSAGALIAMAAENLQMRPGSSIGAAEPIPYSEKNVSAIKADFMAVAEARGRNAEVAAAMVDKLYIVEGFEERGVEGPLALSHREALDFGIADGSAGSLKDALAAAGLDGLQVVRVEFTAFDQVARFLTKPWIAILLLIGAIAGLGAEFSTPGVGVPGFLGILALALFMGGWVMLGAAGWVEVGLLLLGIALVAVEVLNPGFGIFGIGGLIAIGASIFLTAPTPALALQMLTAAAVGLVIFFMFFARQLTIRGLGRFLTLGEAMTTADGYVPARVGLQNLVGKEGQTVTPLRPAGTVAVDGEPLDVVSEGGFVAQGVRVRVIRVEGTRVVVRPLNGEDSSGEQ